MIKCGDDAGTHEKETKWFWPEIQDYCTCTAHVWELQKGSRLANKII